MDGVCVCVGVGMDGVLCCTCIYTCMHLYIHLYVRTCVSLQLDHSYSATRNG